MPITYQFIPGTIIIPIGEGRIVTVTPNPEWRNGITQSAQIYHSSLEELETRSRDLRTQTTKQEIPRSYEKK